MSSKKILCLLVVIAVFAIQNVCGTSIPSLGAPEELTGEGLNDAKETLQNSLSKLASGDGPHYRLSKIITASRQVVSGTAYKIHAELINDKNETKKCDIGIWSQSWLENGIEVTFECDGENKLVKKHSA